jgi:hypothetical protein
MNTGTLADTSVKTDSSQNANIGTIVPQVQPQAQAQAQQQAQPLLLIKDREPQLVTLKAVDWSVERLWRRIRSMNI